MGKRGYRKDKWIYQNHTGGQRSEWGLELRSCWLLVWAWIEKPLKHQFKPLLFREALKNVRKLSAYLGF